MGEYDKGQAYGERSEAASPAGRFRALGRLMWSDEGSLGRKAMRSGVWIMGSAVATHVLRFVQMLILVRLLVPGDFGIMRIAGFIIHGIDVFSSLGLGWALIHRKDVSEETLSTAWTMGLLRAAAIYAAIFFCAPWVAGFYKTPVVSPILRVVALRIVLAAAANTSGVVMLRKELQFHKHETYEAACNAFSILVTVVAAYYLRSAWALAVGQVAFGAIRVVGSYWVHPFRPRFFLDRKIAGSLWRYGWHIMFAGIVIYLKTEGDDMIVGKMTDEKALGLYALAYTLSNMPATFITHTISGAGFSLYSKLQDNREHLGRAFIRVFRLNAALAVPAALGMAILAPDIVNVIYTPKYAAMIPCFVVLCFFGLQRALGSPCGPVYGAVGKPYILAWTGAGNLVVMLSIIFPLVRSYGILGAAWATLIPGIPHLLLSYFLVTRIARLSLWAIIRVLWQVSVPAALMCGAVLLQKRISTDMCVLTLLGSVLTGMSVYLLASLLFSRGIVEEAIGTLRYFKSSRRSRS